jgi:hypothetical protein
MDILFSDSVGMAYPQFRSGYPPLFVVGAIPLDSQVTGYVVRAPDLYDSFTKLGLIVYDGARQGFGPGVELAEAVGDAGSFYFQCAWFVRSGDRHQVQLYQTVKHSQMDLDIGRMLSEVESLTVRTWTGRTFTSPRLIRDPAIRERFAIRKWLSRQRAPA